MTTGWVGKEVLSTLADSASWEGGLVHMFLALLNTSPFIISVRGGGGEGAIKSRRTVLELLYFHTD